MLWKRGNVIVGKAGLAPVAISRLSLMTVSWTCLLLITESCDALDAGSMISRTTTAWQPALPRSEGAGKDDVVFDGRDDVDYASLPIQMDLCEE